LKELVEKGERLLTPPFFKGKIPSLPKPEGMSSPPSPETSGEAGVKSYSKEYENTLKELARKQADFEFEIRQLDRNTYEQKRQEIYRWATTLEEELSKSGDLTTQMQQQIASTAKVQLDLLGAERTKEEISKRVKAIADGLQKEEELHKQYQTDVVEFLMSEEEHIRDSYARRIKIVNEHVQNQEKATRLIKQLHEKMNEDIADLGKKTFGEDLENAITGWASHFSGELNDMLWNAEMTFGNIAESFAKMITQMIIQKQIVEPLVSDFGGWMSDIFPFAKGGVINHPTVFPMAKGYGLAGEAGSEAILPLARIGGDLGVKAATGDVNVYIENNSSAEGRVEGTNRNAQGGLDIFVKIDEMTAANIRSPGKRTHKALRETFGARPVVMGR
jgi:translation initiation factor 2 beta subunit (eIF-2beta)/eIF-5